MNYLDQQHDFWDNLAKQWTPQNRDHVVGWYDQHEAFPYYDTILFKGIPETENKVALEYGCGPGRNIIRFNKRFKRIDGVDISENNIRNAKSHLESRGITNVYLYANDGQTLPMIDRETYDVVFSVICLQHINSHAVRQSIFAEIYRVLKYGGYFVGQMGCGPGHPRSVDYHNSGDSYSLVATDVRIENIADFQDDLESLGFKSIHFTLTEPCCDEHPQWLWFSFRK